MSNSLIVITGASRGIGRAIAVSISDAYCKGQFTFQGTLSHHIHLVLIARSKEKLEETAKLVHENCNQNSLDMNITASCHELDLSNLDTLPNHLKLIFNPLAQLKYESCWLFNNAGSVEPLGQTSAIANDVMDNLRTAVDLNITSSMWLSAAFANTFACQAGITSLRIINISSLCALEPFPTMAVYCAGKAARDMFHQVLAKECSTECGESMNGVTSGVLGKAVDHFKVLNYAPGACDTSMTDVLANCPMLDTSLHEYFSCSKREKKLVDPADSARKLIDLLAEDKYSSGAHVDYWDALYNMRNRELLK